MLIQACRREFQVGELVFMRESTTVLTVRRYSLIRRWLGRPYVLCETEHAGTERGQWHFEKDLVSTGWAIFDVEFV